MSSTILVVDDDSALAEMVGLVLTTEGFDVTYSSDGISAVTDFEATHPDLVLLDLMLPGRDGIEVCRMMRETSVTPIIMLTAKSDTGDVVRGLESGADDYIVKPFKPQELVARVRARLRPSIGEHPSDGGIVTIGDIAIDTRAHVATRDGVQLALTPLEFSLLVTLASHPGQVFTRETLLEQVWGYQYKADTRLVNVHVQRLRAKVEHNPDDPQIVVTVRGVGYRAGG
ncbi:MAG TPA: response regulator transcription factor [Pseudoclavibacter sp.]|nr:response regulator transcription factor [Pseudoclavibacter sp.]